MSIFKLFLLSFYMCQPFFVYFIQRFLSHRYRYCLHFYLVLYPRSHQMFLMVILLNSFKEILLVLFVAIGFIYLFRLVDSRFDSNLFPVCRFFYAFLILKFNVFLAMILQNQKEFQSISLICPNQYLDPHFIIFKLLISRKIVLQFIIQTLIYYENYLKN